MSRTRLASIVTRHKESPNDKFTRLAIYRVNHLLRVGDQIENLFGRVYASTPAQRQKILDTVEGMAERLKIAATQAEEKPPERFTF